MGWFIGNYCRKLIIVIIIISLTEFRFDINLIDLSLRTLIFFLSKLDDEKSIKQFQEFVPKILPPLFSAFTNDEVDAHGRE